jgi:hypothetical protein
MNLHHYFILNNPKRPRGQEGVAQLRIFNPAFCEDQDTFYFGFDFPIPIDD